MSIDLLVDGEPMEIKDPRPLTVLCHPGEMEIEAPRHVLVDPETTVKVATELEPDQWALIRVEPNFLRFWEALWDKFEPPENLQKANLAVRHSVGMMLMLVECAAEGKSPFLKLPETYMHPRQQARLVSMIYAILPHLKSKP